MVLHRVQGAQGPSPSTSGPATAAGVNAVSAAAPSRRAFALLLRPLSDPSLLRRSVLTMRDPAGAVALPLCGLPQDLLLAAARTLIMADSGDPETDVVAPTAVQLRAAADALARAIRGDPDAVAALRPPSPSVVVGGTVQTAQEGLGATQAGRRRGLDTRGLRSMSDSGVAHGANVGRRVLGASLPPAALPKAQPPNPVKPALQPPPLPQPSPAGDPKLSQSPGGARASQQRTASTAAYPPPPRATPPAAALGFSLAPASSSTVTGSPAQLTVLYNAHFAESCTPGEAQPVDLAPLRALLGGRASPPLALGAVLGADGGALQLQVSGSGQALLVDAAFLARYGGGQAAPGGGNGTAAPGNPAPPSPPLPLTSPPSPSANGTAPPSPLASPPPPPLLQPGGGGGNDTGPQVAAAAAMSLPLDSAAPARGGKDAVQSAVAVPRDCTAEGLAPKPDVQLQVRVPPLCGLAHMPCTLVAAADSQGRPVMSWRPAFASTRLTRRSSYVAALCAAQVAVLAADGVTSAAFPLALYADFGAAAAASLAAIAACAGLSPPPPSPPPPSRSPPPPPPSSQLAAAVSAISALQQASDDQGLGPGGEVLGLPPMVPLLPPSPPPQPPARAGGLQDPCVACAPGSFSAAADASSCLPCPVGSFAALAGQPACSPCAPGTFAMVHGASACRCGSAAAARRATAPVLCAGAQPPARCRPSGSSPTWPTRAPDTPVADSWPCGLPTAAGAAPSAPSPPARAPLHATCARAAAPR